MTPREHRDTVDGVLEQVEERSRFRRAEDTQRNGLLLGLVGLIFAGGIAWGTARAATDSKVDRIDFVQHVAESNTRLTADSIRRAYQDESLRRIEAKQDSMNARLSQLICRGQPNYCK